MKKRRGNMGKDSQLLAEVQLSWEVMTCRGLRTTYDKESPCQWFNQRYGPYPAYTVDDLPVDIVEEGKSRSIKGKCVGERYNVPELMSGCRKAPIMSIGINPNLTAYQTSVAGATWCYPYFDNIEKYARYFRYRTINQERFSLDFVKKYVVPGTAVKAAAKGCILSISRGTDNITISLKYAKSGNRTLRVPMNYSIFYDAGEKNRDFSRGDILAGLVELPQDVAAEVIQEPVGYYRQFNAFLDRFKKLAGNPLKQSKFQIGEDACQADMVACASPGWNAYFPDKTRSDIVQECVKMRLYMAEQLIQTRPAVIVFAGNSALNMFLQIFDGKISPEVNPFEDTFELLQKALKTPYWLRIAKGGYGFKSRLIFSPHFSYWENFLAGCRMPAQQWEDFVREFPADEKLVRSQKRNVFGGVLLTINPSESPWPETLSAGAREMLAPYYMDPVDIIARIMLQEYEAGRIKLDKKTEHLVRTGGPCRFCSNELFRFKEGCPYGKLGVVSKNKDSAQEVGKAAMSVVRS
jgi:hypothetical protein